MMSRAMAHEIILYQNYFSKNTQRPYFGRSDQMTKMSFRLRLTTMGRDTSVVKGKNLKIGSCHVGFFLPLVNILFSAPIKKHVCYLFKETCAVSTQKQPHPLKINTRLHAGTIIFVELPE